MAALIDAGNGYSGVADWFDTTPQPDSADSLASLQNISGYVSFILSPFALISGKYVNLGEGSRETWGLVGE